MPWSETSPVNERLNFISDFLNERFSFSELCERYGVSRPTGYKWVERYDSMGPSGLEEQPRRPHSSPRATCERAVEALIALRKRHPKYGAKKLIGILRRRDPGLVLPATSTGCAILKRHGLVKARRQRWKPSHPGKPRSSASVPNEIWTADFKGQFRTRDGIYCYPLTVADLYSRYVLECRGLSSTRHSESKPVFERLFREHGLPQRIRTDNGVPFATIALGRLSELSVWWIRLGIIPELIEPASPHQNGTHERMHKDLKYEATIPPERNRRAQQRRFDTFRRDYNEIRPHESNSMLTPAELYMPSPRAYPAKLPQLEYPEHFEVRRVSTNGGIRWHFRWINVSHVLGGEYIGLEPIDDGLWSAYFGPLLLGRFDERLGCVIDREGTKSRNPRRV